MGTVLWVDRSARPEGRRPRRTPVGVPERAASGGAEHRHLNPRQQNSAALSFSTAERGGERCGPSEAASNARSKHPRRGLGGGRAFMCWLTLLRVMQTREAYLSLAGNALASTERLRLHRTSLYYRVRHMSELADTT